MTQRTINHWSKPLGWASAIPRIEHLQSTLIPHAQPFGCGLRQAVYLSQ